MTTSWPANEGDPAGHFVRAHARELERNGDVVEVVAPPPGGAFGWPGVAARVRERPSRALDAARWVLAARRELSALAPDRIVAHWAIPSALPIAAASPAPMDVVSHGGDVRLLVTLPAFARRALVREVARRATEWAFASIDLLNDLRASLDAETRERLESVAVVRAPPFELPDVRAAVAARRRALAGSRLAVCVGRLVAGKRVDRVIAYVAEAVVPCTLVVVGDGPERGRLERYAYARGVDARFIGAVDRNDALAWIGAADVLIHASEAEGLSTVLREAAALGTNVVRLS